MSKGNGRSELCDYEHEMSILTQLDEADRTIEAQRQEIQKLQAQVARMREALEHIREYWNRDNNEKAMLDACWESINTAESVLIPMDLERPTEYHNPADVEALAKAREALSRFLESIETTAEACGERYDSFADWEPVKQALAAINKVGGGEI
jgi:predicted nuclease with TOPRIM domain